MPHFTTFDNFASKAIVHPQFQEGSKAIVHPQFQEAAKAIVHPQFQPEAGRAIVHPQFQPEADGYMKLDDIKGEFASNASVTYREDGANRFTGKRLNWDAICDVGTAIKQESVADSLTNPDHALGLDVGPVNQGADVWTNGSATSVKNALHSDYKPQEAVNDVGWWTVDGADFRDHNHGKRSNWDAICDVGTAIKQDGIDLQSDALVQQVNDFAGLISPDQMRPAEYFSHNPEWFAPGSAVDSWTEKTFGNGDGEILGGISQGNVFAPINVLRNGYDCEGAGAC